MGLTERKTRYCCCLKWHGINLQLIEGLPQDTFRAGRQLRRRYMLRTFEEFRAGLAI